MCAHVRIEDGDMMVGERTKMSERKSEVGLESRKKARKTAIEGRA